MDKIVMFILIGCLWLSVMIFFKRSNMNFFQFMAGSVGTFLISIMFFITLLESSLSVLIANTLAWISHFTGYFEVYKTYSIITFDAKRSIVSMMIDYECSGVIEMLVFTSLAAFFPFGGMKRRAWSIVLGNAGIFAANILRVLFIVAMTKTLGNSYFYLAHTLLGRILFFIMMVVIYYQVFTTTHLRYQSVGEIK